MARRSLAGMKMGRVWPSIDEIPSGTRREDFEDHGGIRYLKPQNPDFSPFVDPAGTADFKKTFKASNPMELLYGLKLSHPGHVTAATMIGPMPGMVHWSPTNAFTSGAFERMVGVGDPGPDFKLIGPDVKVVTNCDFLGRVTLLGFRRILNTKIFCPGCLPSMDQLSALYGEFGKRGVKVVSIYPTSLELAKDFNDAMGVDFPVYSDPDWNSYYAYHTNNAGSLPLQTWVILDEKGVVRWIYRSGVDLDAKGFPLPGLPMPSYLLKQIDTIFGQQKASA